MYKRQHEKRGSIAAANTIVLLTVLARIMTVSYTHLDVYKRQDFKWSDKKF